MSSPVEFYRLTSGQNSQDDPSFIADAQCQKFQNMRPYASGKIKTRGGTKNLVDVHVYDASGDAGAHTVNATKVIKDFDPDNANSLSLFLHVVNGKVRYGYENSSQGHPPPMVKDGDWGVDAVTSLSLVAASAQGVPPLASIAEGESWGFAFSKIYDPATIKSYMKEVIVAGNYPTADTYSGTDRVHPAAILESPLTGHGGLAARKWGITRPTTSFPGNMAIAGGRLTFTQVIVNPSGQKSEAPPADGSLYDSDADFTLLDLTGADSFWIVNMNTSAAAKITAVNGQYLFHETLLGGWTLNDVYRIYPCYEYVYFYRRINYNASFTLTQYLETIGRAVVGGEQGNYLPTYQAPYQTMVDSAHNSEPCLFGGSPTYGWGSCGFRATVNYSLDKQVTHICLARRDPGFLANGVWSENPPNSFKIVAWKANNSAGGQTTIDDNFGPVLDISAPEIVLEQMIFGPRGYAPRGGMEADCYGGTILNIYGHSVIRAPYRGHIVFGNDKFPNRVWFTQGGTEPRNYHIFLENDFFDLPSNGDRLMAGICAGGYLYLFQNRHTWRVTFTVNQDPASPDQNLIFIDYNNADAIKEISDVFGCESPRGVCEYENLMFVTTHLGLLSFDGQTFTETPLTHPIEDEIGLDNLSNAQVCAASSTIYLITKKLADYGKLAVGKMIKFDAGGLSWAVDKTNVLDVQAIAPIIPAGENIYYDPAESGVDRGDTRLAVCGFHGNQTLLAYSAIYDDPALGTDFTFSKTGGSFDAVLPIENLWTPKRLGDAKNNLRPLWVKLFAELMDPNIMLIILASGDKDKFGIMKMVKSNLSRRATGEPYQNRFPTGTLAAPPAAITGGALGNDLNAGTAIANYTQQIFHTGIGPFMCRFWDFQFSCKTTVAIIANRVLADFNVTEAI